MIKRAILCIFVHMYICLCIWAFFCLLAVSWNGLGLFLSGLIRGSRLHPSLITLLRANIPFIFSLFHSSSPFVVSGLGRGSATFFSFFLSFIIISFIFLAFKPPSYFFKLPQRMNPSRGHVCWENEYYLLYNCKCKLDHFF